jgi:DNA-binding response OmpR family regulator
MGLEARGKTTVLFVDDEPELLYMYETMLGEMYETETATSGDQAFETMNRQIDVVFLDRRMPGMSGDELLDELRERGYDVPVAMVTAVEPDEDIIEMPFDDYLTKPIDRELLIKKINILDHRASFNEKSREFFRLASKKATLEAKDSFDHTESVEYRRLVSQIADVRADLEDTLGELVSEDPKAAFQAV